MEQLPAKRIKTNEMMGKGCVVQAVALVLPFLGALGGAIGIFIGIIAAVAVFIQGSRMSVVWKCGNCKNPLAGHDVTVCPACRATLS